MIQKIASIQGWLSTMLNRVKGEFDAEFELTKEVPTNPDNTKIMHLKGEFQLRIVD